MSCTKWPVKRGTSWVSSACSAPVPATSSSSTRGRSPRTTPSARRPGASSEVSSSRAGASRIIGAERRHVVEQVGGAGLVGGGAERQHQQLVQRLGGALGGGIEAADRLDVVAEELQPHRARVARHEDVDDAAPHAPLPHLDDRLRALVAGRLEGLQQQLALQAVAGADAQRAGRELGRRRQRRVETGRRRHHHHRLAGAQPPGDDRALGVGLAVVTAPPQTRLPLGELQHGGAEELQILRPPVGIDHRADDDDGRTRVGAQELGDGQRATGAGEAGHAQTSVSLGEGLRQGLERLPILQHRSGFTVSRGCARRARAAASGAPLAR